MSIFSPELVNTVHTIYEHLSFYRQLISSFPSESPYALAYPIYQNYSRLMELACQNWSGEEDSYLQLHLAHITKVLIDSRITAHPQQA